jgi:hypothetical protein
MVNYVQAVSFHSFDHSHTNAQFYQMSSFGESKAESFFRDRENSREFVKYNMKQLAR